MSEKPLPQYIIHPITVISPKGVDDAWGIMHEPTEEMLMIDNGTDGTPWMASSKMCALMYVRWLNCIDDVEPECLCPRVN